MGKYERTMESLLKVLFTVEKKMRRLKISSWIKKDVLALSSTTLTMGILKHVMPTLKQIIGFKAEFETELADASIRRAMH